jgi:acyl-CoA thioester hydrolase
MAMGKLNYVDDFEKWQSEFSFYTPIKVRFSETDMNGHMNNISAFTYMEQARLDFFESKGLLEKFFHEEGMMIVGDLQCDYHQQMYFNDKIKMYVKIDYIGTTSADLHYLAVNHKNEVTLTGRNRLVYLNMKTNKTIPIPEKLKHKLLSNERK